MLQIILRQLNVSHQYAYLTFIGQYANLLLATPASQQGIIEATGGLDIPRSLKYLMIFIKDFENLSKTPRRMFDTFIPHGSFPYYLKKLSEKTGQSITHIFQYYFILMNTILRV